jgi:hypothetical protein
LAFGYFKSFTIGQTASILTVPAKNAAANADPNARLEIFSSQSAFVSCLARTFLSIVNNPSGHFLGHPMFTQHRNRLRHSNET